MRKRSKLSVLVILSFFVLSLFPANAFAASFSDVSGDSAWAAKYVEKLAELGVVNGVAAGKFDPAGKVTRAQFAKMIVEAKGLAKETPATATFSDVAAANWAYGYVEAAAKAGYVNGMGNGKFAPDAYITREQIAKIVVEAAGLDADASKTVSFSDAAKIADWAKGYVAVAVAEKLVNGYTDNTFRPAGNATRAEAAKLTYSVMVADGKIKETITGNVVSKDYEKGDGDIEIGGTLYDFANGGAGAVLKIAGEFVAYNSDNAELFVKGTPVTVTFGDNDEIVILEATGKYTEGTLQAKSNSGDDVATVDGKELVFVDSDDVKGSLSFNDLTIGSNYKFLINADGKAYGALEADAKRVNGKIAGFGVKRVGDDYQYFIKLDGEVYNYEKASTDAAAKAKTAGTITVDGDAAVWSDLSTDLVANIKVNGDGYVTEVKAFNDEITGYTNIDKRTGFFAKFFKPGSDSPTYIKNILVVDGNVFVGEKTTQADVVGLTEITDAEGLILMVSSSATVKEEGSTKEFKKLKADYYATLSVNGDGVVTAIDSKDEAYEGQVEAITTDDKDEITSITIGGKKYTFNKDVDFDNTDANDNDIVKVGKTVVKLTLNSKSEVISFTYTQLVEKDADTVKTYTVVATPFLKGRPMTGSDDTYAAGGTLRVMDSNGKLFVVDVLANDAELVKAGAEVKLADIKVSDSIAVDVLLVEGQDTAVNYVIVAPATAIK